ncbi:MAG: UvrD-helicase domain-containing protein, partial [Gammaproteobacteria bacterium]|nr:UvrD-helicase domain-containing protein [Gammaproteobacteria bacterium]
MPHRLADGHARRRALDPARSFIVQAPAGSGKTELLVRRFLVLLATVSEPERIVAITFTRKAAGEMRARVIAALRLAREAQPADPVAATLWHLARAALANDERHGWQLQTCPTRLRIQTIDALSAALTRQMPWLSRFGLPMRIVEDADELYREAATATVRRLGSVAARRQRAIADVIAHLDNDILRLTSLLVEMLRHRDQWLRHVIRQDESPDRRVAAEQAWKDMVESVLREARDLMPPPLAEPLVELARFAGDSLSAGHADSPIAACRGLVTLPPPLAAWLSEWYGLAELLLTRKDAWRRSVNVKQGLPPGSEQRAAMLALLDTLSGESGLRRRLAEIRRVPGPRFGERQWQVVKSLIEVLPFAAAELQLVFRERGRVDFPEITESARLALGSEEPTDLALRLDYRIEHLLVDEFQDTSVSQFELLEQLTLGWQGDDGRTLFLVGDPMQSIYRFREAEVGLFLSVMQSGWGQVPMETLTLT